MAIGLCAILVKVTRVSKALLRGDKHDHVCYAPP